MRVPAACEFRAMQQHPVKIEQVTAASSAHGINDFSGFTQVGG